MFSSYKGKRILLKTAFKQQILKNTIMLKNGNLMQWVALGLLLLAAGNMQAQGIEFEHGTWEAVKAKAQKENKPIFVDAYTTWCGPCKWMAKNIFVQDEVGVFLNQNFISYKMDMEKGEGPAFAEKYGVEAYPTLLYFNAEGEVMHKGVGARDAEGLIALCNDALDPKKQLVGFVNKYESGNYEKAFLAEYMEVLVSCGEDVSAPFEKFWETLTDEEKQTEKVLTFMSAASYRFAELENQYTQYLLENKAAYEKATSKGNVAMLLTNTYLAAVWKIAKTEDKKKKKELTKEILAVFPDAKKEFKKRLAYVEASMETPPNEAKIQKTYTQYLKVCNDANELNSVAWKVYENEDDLKKLKEALGWIDRSIKIEANFFNLDTKAALLYKTKDYEAAKVYAEKALKAAKDSGMDTGTEDTVKLLENINAKLEQ
ncbi:thioredoxin domain-containing protein [Aureispira anguillae]|uniref:Thioredoxin domain-containing protein n=2 Tax=Aureispira anguillae TaxID=2864201 RepID=A0A916DTW3_9BACT|nr:thioredoxin domain-containing protein [Aureispira anguillae]